MYRHFANTVMYPASVITVGHSGLTVCFSSDAEKSEKEKIYLHKLNMILVQILKQEWPKNWPTFISGKFYSCLLYTSDAADE